MLKKEWRQFTWLKGWDSKKLGGSLGVVEGDYFWEF
jgi:hypothetical protein